MLLLGILEQAGASGLAIGIAAPIAAVVLGQVVMGIWTLAKVHGQGKRNAERLDSIDSHIAAHCIELKEVTLAVNTLNVKMENTEKMVDEIRKAQAELAKASRG